MSIKPWHLEWNTPGSPETERRDLAASYRDIIDTKPLRFLKPNPEISWKSNRKPEKDEWTEPIEKPKRRKQGNPHTFPTLKYLNLGRLMRCNVCEKYEPFCKKKKMTAEIQFVSYATSGQTRQLLRRKLCTNINQPYLIWAAVLCHVPQPREPMILGPRPQSRWRKKTWMYCPWWWLVMVVTPKMKSGRPII